MFEELAKKPDPEEVFIASTVTQSPISTRPMHSQKRCLGDQSLTWRVDHQASCPHLNRLEKPCLDSRAFIEMIHTATKRINRIKRSQRGATHHDSARQVLLRVRDEGLDLDLFGLNVNTLWTAPHIRGFTPEVGRPMCCASTAVQLNRRRDREQIWKFGFRCSTDAFKPVSHCGFRWPVVRRLDQ